MLTIYICEDEKELLKHYETLINNYIMIENLDAMIAAAATVPDTLLKLLENKTYPFPGLYFLDVNLHNKMNGIILADRIRKYDPRGFIVFITAIGSALPSIMEHNIEAMNFINKNTPDEIGLKITSCIRIAYERYCSIHNSIQKTLRLTLQDKTFIYNTDEIVCIQTAEFHTIAVYTMDSRRTFRGSLNSIGGELDENYFRCHDSCILNLNYVKEIDRLTSTARMRNGVTCKISYRRMQQLNKLLKS